LRKVINGRTYNTGTAKYLGSSSNTALYKNSKGNYFKFNEFLGEIGPLTEEEAHTWAKKYLNIDLSEPAEESASDLVNRERVNLTIDNKVIANMRKYSEQTGIAMGRMVDKAIMERYGKQFKEMNKE
jgi:hypothetical protein